MNKKGLILICLLISLISDAQTTNKMTSIGMFKPNETTLLVLDNFKNNLVKEIISDSIIKSYEIYGVTISSFNIDMVTLKFYKGILCSVSFNFNANSDDFNSMKLALLEKYPNKANQVKPLYSDEYMYFTVMFENGKGRIVFLYEKTIKLYNLRNNKLMEKSIIKEKYIGL